MIMASYTQKVKQTFDYDLVRHWKREMKFSYIPQIIKCWDFHFVT